MDIVVQLRSQAEEIAIEGHAGWGNTMILAAEEIERFREASKPSNPADGENPVGCPHWWTILSGKDGTCLKP